MEISFTTVEEVLGMAFRPSGSAEDVAQLNLTGQGQVIINDKVVYDGTLHAQVGDYQARMNTTNGNLCHGQLLFMLQQSMDKRRKKFGPVLTIHGDGVYTPNSSKTTAAIDPAWCTIELRSNKKKKR